MKKNILIILLILCMCSISNSIPAQQNEKFLIGTNSTEETPLLNVLTIYGEKYNCFFTIEEVTSNETERINSISSRLVYKQNHEKTSNQNLEVLRDELGQLLPDAYIEPNAHNPRIIHIIDSRLKEQKAYNIDEVIPIINFKGTPSDLVKSINKQKPNISLPPFAFTHEYTDGTSIIHVKGNNLTVRDVLSNFIKLPRNNKVIWIAKTNIAQEQKTYVRFVL